MRYLLPLFLLLASCGKLAPPGAAHIDTDLLKLIPSDSTILVGGKLEALRKTPLFEKYLTRVPLPQLDKFAQDTGLDPRKDLAEILYCSTGQDAGVLLVRGRFNPPDLEAKAEARGAKRTQYKNRNLLGDDRAALFFLNPTTAIAGAIPRLKAIIDGAPAGLPPLLVPLVESVSIDAQFWAVFQGAITKAPLPDEGMMGIVGQMIRSIQEGVFSADLRNGLDVRAKGKCGTDKEAKLVHDGLRGAVGFGRLNSPEELLPAFDGIKVQQQAQTVEVTVNIPLTVVERFVDTFFGRATSSPRELHPPGSSIPRPR